MIEDLLLFRGLTANTNTARTNRKPHPGQGDGPRWTGTQTMEEYALVVQETIEQYAPSVTRVCNPKSEKERKEDETKQRNFPIARARTSKKPKPKPKKTRLISPQNAGTQDKLRPLESRSRSRSHMGML